MACRLVTVILLDSGMGGRFDVPNLNKQVLASKWDTVNIFTFVPLSHPGKNKIGEQDYLMHLVGMLNK
jgi:hypothetical protein